MRVGLRLQLLLLLGLLLLVSFLPLYYAIATYARVSLHEVQRSDSEQLGRSVCQVLLNSFSAAGSSAVGSADTEHWRRVVKAATDSESLLAAAVHDASGRRLAGSGPDTTLERLDAQLAHGELATSRRREWTSSDGDSLVVSAGAGDLVASVVVRLDARAAGAPPLVGLVGLYTAVMALALLVMAYFALTRWLVRPLDGLSRTVQQIAAGSRKVSVPEASSHELRALGENLQAMAVRLREHEAELRQKIDEAQAAREHVRQTQGQLIASERMASVGRLSAGLAHELGNPLAAISGMQDLLLAGGLSEHERRDFLERMQRETERINKILRDLLAFARPTGGEPGSDVPGLPGDVEAAVHDTVTLLAPQKSMQQMQVRLDVFPELPKVPLSREHLVQVLLNLALNAADACEQEGSVLLKAQRNAGGVQIEVTDDGPGVVPAIAEQIFEPFFSTKEVGRGTGLGLAVCRGLVHSAGGELMLDGSHATGARFVIQLPAATQRMLADRAR